MLEPREIGFIYQAVDDENEMAILEGLCEGFVRANEMMIASDPEHFPCCNSCGSLHYSDPKPCAAGRRNCQKVKGAYALLQSGYGTCIDLACFYAAIKRKKDGEDCWVAIDSELDANGNAVPNAYHAFVRFADGRVVDPAEEAKNNESRSFACEGSCGDHH
jgi:hypothetical protein